jgi:hypothetical protein
VLLMVLPGAPGCLVLVGLLLFWFARSRLAPEQAVSALEATEAASSPSPPAAEHPSSAQQQTQILNIVHAMRHTDRLAATWMKLLTTHCYRMLLWAILLPTCNA